MLAKAKGIDILVFLFAWWWLGPVVAAPAYLPDLPNITNANSTAAVVSETIHQATTVSSARIAKAPAKNNQNLSQLPNLPNVTNGNAAVNTLNSTINSTISPLQKQASLVPYHSSNIKIAETQHQSVEIKTTTTSSSVVKNAPAVPPKLTAANKAIESKKTVVQPAAVAPTQPETAKMPKLETSNNKAVATSAKVDNTKKTPPTKNEVSADQNTTAADENTDDTGDEEVQDKPVAKPIIPKIFLYWDARLDTPPPQLKVDALILSYAVLKHDKKRTYITDYTASENFQKAGSMSYAIWNSWLKKFSIIGGKAYLAYGGQVNDLLRGYIINANLNDLTLMANEMLANMRRYHFSGLNIDVQYWWNYSHAENEKFARNLAILVKLLRKQLNLDPDFKQSPITIALGWNAAGKVNGLSDFNSPYTGSMQPFFADAEAVAAVDYFVILTFGMNYSEFYTHLDKVNGVMMNFIGLKVPKEKLILAMQPYPTADSDPLDPYDVVLLARELKKNAYGGAAIYGLTPGNSVDVRADEYIEALRNGLEVIDILPPPPKPR